MEGHVVIAHIKGECVEFADLLEQLYRILEIQWFIYHRELWTDVIEEDDLVR